MLTLCNARDEDFLETWKLHDTEECFHLTLEHACVTFWNEFPNLCLKEGHPWEFKFPVEYRIWKNPSNYLRKQYQTRTFLFLFVKTLQCYIIHPKSSSLKHRVLRSAAMEGFETCSCLKKRFIPMIWPMVEVTQHLHRKSGIWFVAGRGLNSAGGQIQKGVFGIKPNTCRCWRSRMLRLINK